MRRLGWINAAKKAVAGSLAAMMVVSGFTMMPKVEASENISVDYQKIDNAVTYWNAKTAPVNDGYVFGGWYEDEAGMKALTEVSGAAYAKWVPATVLSVKTQSITEGDKKIEGSATTSAEKTDLRLLSAVDSTNYQYCGFELLYGNKEVKGEDKQIKKVYKKIEFEGNNTLTAVDTFGTGAEYFFALNISDIAKQSYVSKIYVRPYWVTLDGTKVFGLAKLVRVEDHYADYDYYSLSVNLFGGDAIAAGKAVVTYDASKYKVIGDNAIETGRVLKEMDYKNNNGTITIVANGETVNQTYQADGLFLNIRLQKINTDETEAPTLTILNGSEFCNWNEEDVTVVVQ